MIKNREEVCLYYMGFGLCAKGMRAGEAGCCAGCSHYQASGVQNGLANGIRCFSPEVTGEKNRESSKNGWERKKERVR